MICWLRYEDWINLGVSIILVLAGYLVGTWLIRWLLPRVVRRTSTDLDYRLLEAAGSGIRWLVVILMLQVATVRLAFISSKFKTLLNDVYFVLGLILIFHILWRLISLAAEEFHSRASKAGRQKEMDSLITLSVWVLRITIIIISVSILLSHFGINITIFAVALGIGALTLSLAARDSIADVITGALILIDRPYRIGDRIEIRGIETWGDVVEIGMRSTQILTMNNRMVIVPNSQIGKDQVVNYTYPDPMYLDQTDIRVAYDNDVEQVGHLLVDTVHAVDGVARYREIEALLMAFTENEMIFQVRWWIESYIDYYTMHSRVNRALIKALKDAGVKFPSARSEVNLVPGAVDDTSHDN